MASLPPFDGSLPARIGNYRVEKRIAMGGTSDVLLARADGSNQLVVLKLLLREHQGDEKFARMFITEAAAYSRLSHPAIVKLFDFFSDGDQLVMVLEYVDGLPLHKLRALRGQGRFLDDAAALFVGVRVLGALAAAHGARDPQTRAPAPVIHRDVNPSNVLLPWDGGAKLTDFGIAKVAGVEGDQTQVGYIKGTYGYMAPEQVRGRPVSERADVYAASLLLWELLVGRKAIVRNGTGDLEVLRAMAEPAFPALAALRPDLPPSVLEAMARGLEPLPERRTISASALEGVLRGAFDLERGRARLVDALRGVRPVTRADELAVTVARPPPGGAGDPSAEATIPNPLVRTGAPPAVARPATPLPPRAPVAPTLRLAPPPRPSLAQPGTLTGLSPGASVPFAAPAEPPLPSFASEEPTRPAASPPGPEARAPRTPPPPPPPPPPAAWTPAPMPVAWTPPVPAAMPRSAMPTVPPARARRGVAPLVVALSALGLLLAAAALLVWARTRTSTAYEPPPRPGASIVAASPPPPAPPAAPSAAPVAETRVAPPAAAGAAPPEPSAKPAPAATTGNLFVPPSRAGHRIWVDSRVIGESPGTFAVRCGWRKVRVGSEGTERTVNVPCGGELLAR